MDETSCAYATLLTKAPYLPGILVLEHGLRSVGSRYPLVVMVTPGLSQDARDVLKKRGIFTREIESLQPTSTPGTPLFEDRFADTWTKLRYGPRLYLESSGPLTRPDRAFELSEFRVRPYANRYRLLIL